MNPQTALANLAGELTAFITLLEQEAAVLASGQADALEPLVSRREAANLRLAGLWQALSASLDLPADVGIHAVRERCSSLAAWRETDDLVRQAEHLNRLNSKLIDEQLRHTQAAVQVLRGAAGNRTLYGSDGRMSEFLNPNRDIDTA